MKSLRNSLLDKIFIILAAAAVIVWFYPHQESNRFFYQEGRPWNYAKLIAPFDIPVHADSATILAARDTLDKHFVPIYELNQLIIDTIANNLPASQDRRLRQRLAAELRRLYASGVVDVRTKDEINAGNLPKIRLLDNNVISEMSTAELVSPREAYLYLDSAITDPDLHSA